MDDTGRRTVLIIEDNDINREMLSLILENDYNVLQAENGREGLDILSEHGDRISLVLLDINMPVMNGYEFMDEVRSTPSLAHVPIIVTTSNDAVDDEIQCLKKGASDFVVKPYNSEVVRHRVDNMIHLREASSLIQVIEHDMLTGVLNREIFFWNAERIMRDAPDQDFDLVCTDISGFKFVNEVYGKEEGDRLLRQNGREIAGRLGSGEIVGRIGGDEFAFLVKHKTREAHEALTAHLNEALTGSFGSKVLIKTGVYHTGTSREERDLTAAAMCDRARQAIDIIKNRYNQNCGFFDDEMRRDLEFEKFITDNMEQALAEEQFQVYYQPKHRLDSGLPGGAEALVRWIHPEKGMMKPGLFIPIFEANRFISRLDYYMYEHVCMDLKRWKEMGIPLVPVSVNASRHDFEQPDYVSQLDDLTRKYGIDHELLHIEVTESAYTDNSVMIDSCISELHKKGFRVELDDFGTGYSNLVSLNDFHFDVLKLDMGLIRKLGTDREKNILDFVISIAEWLNMETVAEGAESREEIETLKAKGCTSVQGYYYSKPLSGKDFEAYLKEKMNL